MTLNNPIHKPKHLAELNQFFDQKEMEEQERLESLKEDQRANAWAAMDQIEDEGGKYSDEWYDYRAIYNQ